MTVKERRYSKFSQTHLVTGLFLSLKTYLGKAVHSYKQRFRGGTLSLTENQQQVSAQGSWLPAPSENLCRADNGGRGAGPVTDQRATGIWRQSTCDITKSPWKNRFKETLKN